MRGLLGMLEGGDRRSVGRVDEVVAAVRKDPTLFPELFEGMLVEDEVVCMRAADAAEKLTDENPELLTPYNGRLLGEVAAVDQKEVRWHVAQMIPRLKLTPHQRARAVRILTSWLDNNSNLVKAFSMQALADLAADNAKLRAWVLATIKRMSAEGSPAVNSRGRKLLAKLQRSKAAPQDASPPKTRHAKSARRGKLSTLAYAETFQELRQLVRARAGFLDVRSDTKTEYILTGPMMPRWKKELWFGGVRVGRAYVSLHLMPVYMFPDLLQGLSPGLRARMQGKSCFNFKRVEPELFAEVDALIASCIKRLRTEGILGRPSRP